MRKGIIGGLMVLCFGALLATGGCARKEQVRPTEPDIAQPGTLPAEPGRVPGEEPGRRAEPTPAPLPETRAEEARVAPEARPEAPAAPEEQEAQLSTVYFDFDSSSLSPQARDLLSKNAQYLSRNSQVKVRLEGHCDERGSDEYNMALGERRARAAMDYLVNLGVAPERLSVISYGMEKPAVEGHDEEAWAKNRRVEFVAVR